MLFEKTKAVSCQNHTKLINTLSGHSTEHAVRAAAVLRFKNLITLMVLNIFWRNYIQTKPTWVKFNHLIWRTFPSVGLYLFLISCGVANLA
jgi:hypothetical protein